MRDLKSVGVEVVTFGQYLQPTKRHMKVTRYVTPEEFDEWARAGEALGLAVASGPLVRSSYKAGEFYKSRIAKRVVKESDARPIEVDLAGLDVTIPPPRPTATPGAAQL